MEIKKAIENLKHLEKSLDEYAELNQEGKETFDMAISALEKQERDRWIPVTERLPEYGVEVLTQLSGSGFVDIVVNWVIDEEDEMWFEGGVVAWRPLPEPYTEEEA